MKRMDEIFELPAYSFGRIVADNLSAGGVGSFDSADMAKVAAHAINHADALADALAELLECAAENNLEGLQIYDDAYAALEAYRGAK